MTAFLVKLARRGAGLPATSPAISVAPTALFPAENLAPVAAGLDVSTDPNFFANKDDLVIHESHASQTVANRSAPLRSDGDSVGSHVESITRAPATPGTPLQISATQVPPGQGPTFQVESFRKRTQAANIASTIERSMPSSPASSPPQDLQIVRSGTLPIERGHQDSNERMSQLDARANAVRFSPSQQPNSVPRESLSPSPATEANTVFPHEHWVVGDEFEKDISTPVLVKPAVSEPYERFALSQSGAVSKLAEPMPTPIHVRIGRIEVRGTPSPAAQAPRRVASPAPSGFASYLRLRTYRNWPR